MKILWRKSAIESLLELDQWRVETDLESMANYLKETIDTYFRHQNFLVHIPGRQVFLQHMPTNLRMVLISIGRSDPYKVFYRYYQNRIEIFLIIHPRQKPL
jgi:hypothetical protein